MKKSFAEILEQAEKDLERRMAEKVPSWSGVGDLEYPSSINVQQCSSERTALYKAALSQKICPGGKVADLTGGLGVDSWAFAKSGASEVLYNEMNEDLCASVRRNFEALGLGNVTFRCAQVQSGAVEALLGGFKPDIIFLDPARRSSSGRKVFLLEDCSPDITVLRDELLSLCPEVLVKVSPMADISQLRSRLGANLREVHVVGSGGECKELLLRLRRECGECVRIVEGMEFTSEQEALARPVLHPGPEALRQAQFLLEPSATILKAGCFNLLCPSLGITKIGRSTHLYTAPAPFRTDASDSRIVRTFRIREIREFGGREIKEMGKEYPRCEVTARNLPLSSDELRKKMGATSGGSVHIFAFTADFSGSESEKLIAVTEKVVP